METDEVIAKLKEARRLVHEVHRVIAVLQIESILRHADENLHWALWNLGELEELRPELEK